MPPLLAALRTLLLNSGASTPTNLTPPSRGSILDAVFPPQNQPASPSTPLVTPPMRALSPLPGDPSPAATLDIVVLTPGGVGVFTGAQLVEGTVTTGLTSPLAPVVLALPVIALMSQTPPAAAQAHPGAGPGTGGGGDGAHTTVVTRIATIGPAALLPHQSPVPHQCLHSSAGKFVEVSMWISITCSCPHKHPHCFNHLPKRSTSARSQSES